MKKALKTIPHLDYWKSFLWGAWLALSVEDETPDLSQGGEFEPRPGCGEHLKIKSFKKKKAFCNNWTIKKAFYNWM